MFKNLLKTRKITNYFVVGNDKIYLCLVWNRYGDAGISISLEDNNDNIINAFISWSGK